MSSSSNSGSSGGVGFVGLLTVAFIVLKLTGVITWSWLWVLSPAWISASVGILILLVIAAVALLSGKRGKARR